MQPLPELFVPLQVGRMTVANRLMMAGMSAGFEVNEQGEPTDGMIAYFEERARGEPGMMALGACQVVPEDFQAPIEGVALYRDSVIPSLRRLVDTIHRHDTRIGIQLWNGGGTEGTAASALISPSGLSSNVRQARGDTTAHRLGQANRALETDEIPQIVRYFAQAAERARDAGFDFVEIHAGHGYLISNFLTPLFNRRDDRYGGSFENRTRFLLEIVTAVRDAVGADIVVGLKYNGDDFLGADGWTTADSIRLAPLAEAAGADYITITAGLIGSPKLTIPPMYEPQGCYTDLAAAVKPHVSIPIGTIGRIKRPEMARDIVAAGKADFVCMGRPSIADGDIFGKIKRGELEDIRPCLADCRGCIDEHLRRGGAASCVVNPRVGREAVCIDLPDSAKDMPKTVLVIGGGLAGMEAARRTAFSGHRVILCEVRERLGGQMLLAMMMPGRREIGDIVPWYEHQLAKLGVDVRLSTRADQATLAEIAPDVIIIASGSAPAVPQDMMEIAMNATNIDLLMLDDMLEQDMPIGGNVLVVGGDQNGMVVADYLAQKGCQVTVAEADNHFGRKLAGHDRWYLLNRQNAKRVDRIKNVRGIEIEGDDQLSLIMDDGPRLVDGVDTIVFASERHADRTMIEQAEQSGATTYVVGDAADVDSENAGTIFANIARAYDIARTV